MTIDIIAGTSAGGINGICLGKVIARNGRRQPIQSAGGASHTDAAELILRMLPPGQLGNRSPPPPPSKRSRWPAPSTYRPALSAIVDAEQGLRRIPETTAYLRARIKDIGPTYQGSATRSNSSKRSQR